MEKWDIVYTSTQEDLYRALKYGDVRRVGTAGRIVETVVLGLLAVWCIVPFFAQGTEALGSLLLGLVALFLLAALWLVPEWRARAVSRQEARDRRPTRLRVYDEDCDMGRRRASRVRDRARDRPARPVYPAVRQELVPLPHRALPPDCLAFLRGKWGGTLGSAGRCGALILFFTRTRREREVPMAYENQPRAEFPVTVTKDEYIRAALLAARLAGALRSTPAVVAAAALVLLLGVFSVGWTGVPLSVSILFCALCPLILLLFFRGGARSGAPSGRPGLSDLCGASLSGHAADFSRQCGDGGASSDPDRSIRPDAGVYRNAGASGFPKGPGTLPRPAQALYARGTAGGLA